MGKSSQHLALRASRSAKTSGFGLLIAAVLLLFGLSSGFSNERDQTAFLESLVRSLRASEAESPEYWCTYREEVEQRLQDAKQYSKITKVGEFLSDQRGNRWFRGTFKQTSTDGDPGKQMEDNFEFLITKNGAVSLQEQASIVRLYHPSSEPFSQIQSDIRTFGPTFFLHRTNMPGTADQTQAEYLEQLRSIWPQLTYRELSEDSFEISSGSPDHLTFALSFDKESDTLLSAQYRSEGTNPIQAAFNARYVRLESGSSAPVSIEYRQFDSGGDLVRYTATVSDARPVSAGDRHRLQSASTLLDRAPSGAVFFPVGEGAHNQVHYKGLQGWPAPVLAMIAAHGLLDPHQSASAQASAAAPNLMRSVTDRGVLVSVAILLPLMATLLTLRKMKNKGPRKPSHRQERSGA